MTDNAGTRPNRSADRRLPDRVLDIRTKLFLAFGALAGLIVVASAIAWFAFVTIERSVTHVTQVSVPGMVDALALAETVAEISAVAPAIMASNSHDELAEQKAELDRNLKRFTELSGKLDGNNFSSGGDASVASLAYQLVARLEELGSSVDRRLHLMDRREMMAATVQDAHARFLETLEPLIDDAVFDLVISGEGVMSDTSDSITDLVEEGVSNIDNLLTINAAANLAAGLLAEANNVDDPIALEPIRERFLSSYQSIERSLAQLPGGKETDTLHRACDSLLAIGLGNNNLFEARASALKVGADQSEGTAALAATLKQKHEHFLLVLTPMIDDAAFSLVMTAEDVTANSESAISGLIEGGVNLLTVLLTIRAEGNLIASLLSDAAVAGDENLLLPIVERFTASEERMMSLISDVPDTGTDRDLKSAVRTLLQLGRGDQSVFVLRRAELRESRAGQTALDASRVLSLQLGERVASLVAAAQVQSNEASASSARAIDSGRIVMLVITLAGIVGAALVMFRYVDPRIIRPIGHITSAMTDIAAGDTSVDIPGRDRQDELGRMAQALGVFRDTAIAVQEANFREIQTTRRRLADAIESISEGFSLYDSDDRLVVSNSRYQQLLYPDMAEPFQPGTTFESILQRAVAQGYVKDVEGGAEAWIAERMERHRKPGAPHVQQRRDGRYIMVSERHTEEGGTVAVYSDITELKQRETELAQKSKELEQLAGQLAKYLSPQVYESIFTGRQEVKVASQRKKLTVFFSDIADFTAMTEKLESEELTLLLNQYLTEMSDIALSYGATIDKYVGDAIVIFFGDPDSRGVQQDALDCVAMAITMRNRMQELQTVWRNSGLEQPLECRMGINTGYCTVGNFGSEARVDYTIIGAGVNLASRLESAASPGDILISYETYAWVKNRILCEARDPITVKGISRPVATYRVIDTFERLDRQGDTVREHHPNLVIDMNLAAMSQDERERAKDTLLQALTRLDLQKGPDNPDET